MRIAILGCPVDNLSMAETIELARQAMKTKTRLRHVALNVAKLVNMQSDAILAADVTTSDVVSVDGAGIVLAGWLLGTRIKERVTGIDLFLELLAVCATEGLRPFLLGATNDVLVRAVAVARNRYPMLEFAGTHHGYFGEDQDKAIVDDIRKSDADCLFVAMPTPRKERWLAANIDQLAVPFVMGVGGSFDVLAGKVERAPQIVQASGFEWLYRVVQEPRRLWWRYARTNFIFAFMLCREVVRLRLNPPSRESRIGK